VASVTGDGAFDRDDVYDGIAARHPDAPIIVPRRAGPRASFGPASSDLVLLPDPGFVAEPDLYVARIEACWRAIASSVAGKSLWDGPPLTSRRYSGGGTWKERTDDQGYHRGARDRSGQEQL